MAARNIFTHPAGADKMVPVNQDNELPRISVDPLLQQLWDDQTQQLLRQHYRDLDEFNRKTEEMLKRLRGVHYYQRERDELVHDRLNKVIDDMTLATAQLCVLAEQHGVSLD